MSAKKFCLKEYKEEEGCVTHVVSRLYLRSETEIRYVCGVETNNLLL